MSHTVSLSVIYPVLKHPTYFWVFAHNFLRHSFASGKRCVCVAHALGKPYTSGNDTSWTFSRRLVRWKGISSLVFFKIYNTHIRDVDKHTCQHDEATRIILAHYFSLPWFGKRVWCSCVQNYFLFTKFTSQKDDGEIKKKLFVHAEHITKVLCEAS